MNTNLIHKWLRDPRLSPEDPDMGLPEGEEAAFFPIEVAGVSSTPMARFSPPVSSGLVTAQRVDIALSDGRRILVEGTTALSAVLALGLPSC
ncbi:MAG: transposase [Hyphomonadaceae bacterium]